MLKAGLFIQNRYEIIARIGSGGMADVYKAKDHKLNRFVAVKVLKPEFRDDKAFISKFRAEAQSAAGLAHANIVNVYDVGEEAGIDYIVMELVEGITLKQYIANKGRLSVREATSIALQISAGLEAAHNNGIIHRDVKPQNIIISTDGRVKVTDFGIARATSANTINSGAMGSVHYSSPEQARGGYSDEKSDIYSLGVTMYEMLTGHVPFDGDTAVAIALRHLQEELHGPKEEVPEIPYSTNQIVMKCTQKSPDRRYSNMTELIRDLRESLVNPEGDFVTLTEPDRTSKTIVMSKEELNQIKSEQKMPSYDESMDVGAAANMHKIESGSVQQRAYQPGSYYQKSQYQDVPPGRTEDSYDGNRWNAGYGQEEEEGKREYDPYYDAYDNPDDYAIHSKEKEGGYRLDESFVPEKKKKSDRDGEIGLNPHLEKAVTVGGILVAVVIGCVLLALLANAVGFLNFGKKNSGNKETQAVQTETASETESETESETQSETQSEAQTESGTSGGAQTESGTSGGAQTESGTSGGAQTESGTSGGTQTEASQTFAMDNLSNMELSQAESLLLSRGLQYTVDNTQYNDSVPKGSVISTDPEAGEMVRAGDLVTLYVSQGPREDAQTQQTQQTQESENVNYVTLWDLTGYTQERAEEALSMLGLSAEYVYESSDTIGAGMIIRTSANESGGEVPAGSTVTLYISTGPSSGG